MKGAWPAGHLMEAAAGDGSRSVVPSLWTTIAVAAVLLAVTEVVLAVRADRSARRRRDGVLVGRRPEAEAGPPMSKIMRGCLDRIGRRRARDGLAAAGVALGGALLLGGMSGLLVGVLGAVLAFGWLRRHAAREAAASGDQEERRLEEQLPLVAELVAACLAAGAGPHRAAEAVGDSLDGPAGARLKRVATELRLGAEPAAAWDAFGERPGAVRLARCMARAEASGVPAVEPVSRLAAELRAERARAASGRARRAAVLVTGPLGLCFLPAFLAIGVAPVVLGIARSLW